MNPHTLGRIRRIQEISASVPELVCPTLYHFALQIHPKMRRYFFAGRSEEVVA